MFDLSPPTNNFLNPYPPPDFAQVCLPDVEDLRTPGRTAAPQDPAQRDRHRADQQQKLLKELKK